MKDLLPVLFIAIVLIGIGVSSWLTFLHEKKRTEKLREFADSLGLAYFPGGDPDRVQTLSRFQLFSQGRNKTIRNMVQGITESVNLAIFDYGFVVGGGKSQRNVNQTVVHFDSPLLSLTDFAVRPQTFAHRLGKILGWKDIDFDSHPRFSSAFWLQGSNEEQVRQLFRAPVLEWFEGKLQLSAEGCGTCLIVYRPGRRAKPEEMRSLMEDGFELYGLLHRPN